MDDKSNKLNAAVIGLGQIGNTYDLDPLRKNISSHVGAYLANPKVKLAAACDMSDEKRSLFLKTRGEYPCFSDYHEMLNKIPIDMLSICTHEDTHLQIVKDAVSCGVRAIFCEKPLCNDEREIAEFESIVGGSGVFFALNISRRWDQALIRAAEHVAGGGIGKMRSIAGTYVKGIRNTGTHLVDALMMLFGPVVDTKVFKNRLCGDPDPTPDIHLGFEGFNAFFCGLDANDYYSFEFKAYGSEGALEFLNSGHEIRICRLKEHELFSGFKRLHDGGSPFGTGIQNLMQNAIDDCVERFAAGEKPLCGIYEGIAAARITGGIEKACKAL